VLVDQRVQPVPTGLGTDDNNNRRVIAVDFGLSASGHLAHSAGGLAIGRRHQIHGFG
jgi:hypothetical protein